MMTDLKQKKKAKTIVELWKDKRYEKSSYENSNKSALCLQ